MASNEEVIAPLSTAVASQQPAPLISAPPEPPVLTPYINLPYKGKEGDKIVRSFKRAMKQALPENVQPRVVYTGMKIGNLFQVKDRIPLEHDSNLVYRFLKDEETRYIGETRVREGQREFEHRYADKASSIYKFLRRNPNEVNPEEGEFKILEKGLANKITRKLVESLYIKEYDPDLNRNKRSFKLVLFN